MNEYVYKRKISLSENEMKCNEMKCNVLWKCVDSCNIN